MQPFTGIYMGAIYTWLTFSGGADCCWQHASLKSEGVCVHAVPKSDCLHLLRENKETGRESTFPATVKPTNVWDLKAVGEGDNLNKDCKIIFPVCNNDPRKREMCCYILAIKLRSLMNSCCLRHEINQSLRLCKNKPLKMEKKSISSPLYFQPYCTVKP